jgi:hypothetical protein
MMYNEYIKMVPTYSSSKSDTVLGCLLLMVNYPIPITAIRNTCTTQTRVLHTGIF